MLLRNRVYCAVCGGLLHAEHSTRPGRRSYYRCKASHPEQYRTPNVQGRTPASQAVAQADLDDWVWSTVRATLVDRREVVTEIRRRLEGQRDAPVRSEAAQLEERVAKLERQRAALLRLFTEAEGAMPWATIAPELARLESEHAEALVLLDATRERLGKSAADLARLDGLDTVARRLGPTLVDPDLDTRVQVVAELGLTVRATRLHQTLEWTLPLASGEQSGWAALIDLSHVEEPDEATRAALLAEDLAEVFRDDPDEGTSGRGRTGARDRLRAADHSGGHPRPQGRQPLGLRPDEDAGADVGHPRGDPAGDLPAIDQPAGAAVRQIHLHRAGPKVPVLSAERDLPQGGGDDGLQDTAANGLGPSEEVAMRSHGADGRR